MNRLQKCSFVVAVLLSLLGCGRSLPEAYGIYADTNHGMLRLKGQGARLAGNMMSYYAGLTGPSGVECDSLRDLIVYEKDVNPNSITVAKLQFLKDGRVSTLFSSSQVSVNLWVPSNAQVEVDVKPVEQRRDMYIVTPRTQLDRGFYALYMGRFGGGGGSEGGVFDFVVGSASEFPSYATALTTRREEVKKSAVAVLDRMNEMLNARDYRHLDDVYRPDGRTLSGAELQAFAAGNQTWLSTAGRIIKSELISVTPADNDSARCSVKTTYEKTGPQEESVTIRRIGSQYVVTELK